MKLWEYLGIEENSTTSDADEAFRNLSNINKEQMLAWKVLREPMYSNLYKRYRDIELLYRAGFFEDNLKYNEIDNYNLEIITANTNKIENTLQKHKDSQKQPVVLLSTGGFYPIHQGHIDMMELAAKEINKSDKFYVAGGYFSLCHDDYVMTKPYYQECAEERIYNAEKILFEHDWLGIDNWECLYSQTTVNFSTVIDRLKLFLDLHLSKPVTIAYICGADNAEFAYCFYETNYLFACINRYNNNDKFENTKDIFRNNKNMWFIENNSSSRNYESRQLRRELKVEKGEYTGEYMLRNEGYRPLNFLTDSVYGGIHTIKRTQQWFLEEFIQLITETDGGLKLSIVDVDKQLDYAKSELKNKKTISMDIYFNKDYSLGVSRVFKLADGQFRCEGLTSRNTKETIEESIQSIKLGTYTLVDDDSISGSTIKFVKEKLPDYIEISDTFLLSGTLQKKVYDAIDLRDFIVGSKEGGLVVQIETGEYIRVPYIMPYVNLRSRASLPITKVRDFSIKLWELNKELYTELNPNILAKDTYIANLLDYIRLPKNISMRDFCDWHIKRLQRL